MVHLYLCHMVIVQELPNNKKVATQYKFTIFNLGVRLYKDTLKVPEYGIAIPQKNESGAYNWKHCIKLDKSNVRNKMELYP